MCQSGCRRHLTPPGAAAPWGLSPRPPRLTLCQALGRCLDGFAWCDRTARVPGPPVRPALCRDSPRGPCVGSGGRRGASDSLAQADVSEREPGGLLCLSADPR